MKTTFTRISCIFLFTLAFQAANAQTARVSAANGSWSSPSTWSPAGVPGPGDDITINHQVTYNQNISHGGALFRINAGGALTDIGGDDTVAFGGDLLIVEGYFSVGELAVGMTDSAVNAGVIVVSYTFGQSGLFINRSTGELCVQQQLATSDNFINRGSVSANNWTNGAAVSGSGGRFCIANWFINSDAISGTIDICDATPNTVYDVNVGTIAGSVTYCAAAPCGGCLPNSIAENETRAALEIFPNPFTTSTTIKIDPAFLVPGMNTELVIYDVLGNEAGRIPVTGNTVVMERNNLAAGMYIYQLTGDGKLLARGRVIVE